MRSNWNCELVNSLLNGRLQTVEIIEVSHTLTLHIKYFLTTQRKFYSEEMAVELKIAMKKAMVNCLLTTIIIILKIKKLQVSISS